METVELDQKLSYSKKIVAFIDILGFREQLKRNDSLEVISEQIVNLKTVFSAPYDFTSKFVPEVFQFSDSIIISVGAEIEKSALAFLFKLSLQLRDSFVKHGIIVRGAVFYGDHYFENGVMISPAVANAYELESKFARYPRVLISSSVLDLLKVQSDQTQSSILTAIDDDGFTYLHYLNALVIPEQGAIEVGKVDLDKLVLALATHKEKIESNLLIHSNPSVREKYIWLGNYHNRFVWTISQGSGELDNVKVQNSMLTQSI